MGQDENIGIKKLTLEKNDQYKNADVFIDKIAFKVFDDTGHFLKHKDSVNIFNDKTNILANAVPRLQGYEYILPQYVSVFINTQNIPELSMRTFLLSLIDRDNIIKLLSENNYKPVYNPFITDEKIDKASSEKNIVQIIQSKGYFKKAELIKKLTNSAPKQTNTGTVAEPQEGQVSVTPSKVIISPATDNINFISKDDVLLKGEVKDAEVESVYIGDYKLKAFAKGDDVFYYRLKQVDYETIVEGTNVYKIYFEKAGKKELQEELTFVYFTDTTKLEEEKKKILTKPVIVSATPTETPSTNIDPDMMSKLEGLSDTLYYNKDLETYAYSLYYADTDPAIAQVAQNITEVL